MSRKNNSSVTHSGIGFGGLLAIAFIVLKLIGVINWSWLWVLSPLWIPIALVILFAMTSIIVIGLKILFIKREDS